MTDSLTEGPYQLRYIAPGESVAAGEELYATRVDGVGNPVTASPRTSSLVNQENWWFSKAPDGKTWFIVSQGPLPKGAGHGPVSLGFSHGVVKQGTPVNYAVASGFYVIKPLGNNEYIIAIAPGASSSAESAGREYLVGISSGHALEIQEFTAPVEEQTARVPKWSFEKIK
ncbi:hypothetical protein FRC09_006295 [Ceratobasidium sp. 395]|nr:hypothetical protein FRC09_006295 [Ceratobasidium sp. 395]